MDRDKICCPECGHELVYEVLCQYGIIHKVNPDGRVQKQHRKVDYGSTDDVLLYCPRCYWRCNDFASDGNTVEVNYDDEG